MGEWTLNYDNIALDYAQHRQVHPGVLRSLLSTSGVDCDSKVLEVGCGTGNYTLALEQLVGPSCWGIDPSAGMLARARERSGGVHFQLGQAERLDFPQDFFDLAFSVDVIHHVGERSAYFREVYRVLKAGGKVCTVTDSEAIIRQRQPLAVYFPETVAVDLGRYPPIAELRDLMGEAGFGEMTEETVAFPYQLTEIQAYRDRAFSVLHLIPEEAFQQGIKCMGQDLRTGPIQCVSCYLLLWGTK
jgi:ubiquinone/menaquinone biosynthesis C-methylase UbiE